MKMIKKILFLTLILFSVINLNAQNIRTVSAKTTTTKPSTEKVAKKDKSIAKADTTKKLSPYEKLFYKKKDIKTSAGVVTLHIIEGKLYFELPVKLVGKSFLMGSVVDNVSNMNLAYAGQKASRPIQICFTKTDSLVLINLISAPTIVDSEETGIQEAVKKSSMPSVLNSSPILAYNKDSSSVVFDATSFFLSGSKYIGTMNASSMSGFMQVISTFSKELSSLKGVEAYKDNVAVLSNMTYSLKSYFMGLESKGEDFLTAEMRTTLTLLPEEEFRFRFADYRIGTGVTEFMKFGSKDQGSQVKYLANRWRISPDKPIVIYVDTLFPATWKESVKRGLLKWNKAFARAGYKDVIKVYDYPRKSETPEFNSGNISYSCVRFAQSPSRAISHQINVDPRSGEILSANILFHRDSPVTLQRERMYQTALVEPAVRSYELPDDLLCSSIELAMTREMGFCLGLTANMAASSWMPVDSLRSATFTQKEGITSSVMDQIKYNYIAQPGDIEKGVKLTADDLGPYDYYVINWLYGKLPQATTPAQEKPFLNRMISEKAGDPRFYYGREQSGRAYFDPRAVIEDLGDDKIKAAKYGMNTLKYVSKNATEWVNKDEVDYSYRELFPDFIFLKMYDYYRSLMVNLGGIEINYKYEGDSIPAYNPVDRKIQKESLVYMLEQADDLQWLNNKELLVMSGMNQSFSDFYALNLIKLVFQRIPMVSFAASKSSDPYSVDEMLGDIDNFALKNIRKGIDPSFAQKVTLLIMCQFLVNESNLPNVIEAKAKNKTAFGFVKDDNWFSINNIMQRCFKNEVIIEKNAGHESAWVDARQFFGINSGVAALGAKSGFETLESIKYLTKEDLSPVYYKHLKSLKSELRKGVSKLKDGEAKDIINYMILSIDKGVGI